VGGIEEYSCHPKTDVATDAALEIGKRHKNSKERKRLIDWKARNDGMGGMLMCSDLAGTFGPSVLGVAQPGDKDEEEDWPRL